jgi:putative sporulation protein YyaC
MSKISGHYKDENLVKEMSEKILEYMCDDFVVVNIGTDRCIGDSVAPLVGSYLKEKNFSFPVYGSMHEPIHALNLHKKLEEIKAKHPNSTIVAIDACLGDCDCIGEIQVRDFPISPGRGVGKNLGKVGDFSIVGIVDSAENSELFTNRTIRMSFIMDLSKTITDALLLAEKKYREINRETAISGF